MAINFKAYQSTRKSLGTIAQICGPGGSYKPSSPRNWLDTTKQVAILLFNKEGKSQMVVCSPAVSDGLRNKSIKLSQLQSFEVCEYFAKNGEITNTVTMPAAVGGDMPTVNIKEGVAVEAYQPKPTVFNPQDLVAF